MSIVRWSLAAALTVLGGCASLTQERGMEAVRDMTAPTLKSDLKWVRSNEDAEAAAAETAELMKAPLTAESSTRVALLNNRGLQAAYNDLGLSAAAMVKAIMPANPGFTYSRTEKSGLVEIERKLALDLLGLLTLPFAASIEDRRWEQAKIRTADQILQVASETRRAYFRAVAAQQILAYVEQVKVSSQTAAQMARRLGQSGAFGKLEQAREHVFYAEVMAQLARARQAHTAERERLTRLLGLWGAGTAFKLPDRLPEVPKELPEQVDLEARAIDQRLDIRMARLEVEGLARSYGLTQATRFINVLEGSYLNATASGEPKKTGYEIDLSIPIFDFGTTRVAEAESTYLQAANRLAEIAVNARSEVREQYDSYRLGHELARHYIAEIVPARKAISEETLLRYNGMLASVFELLADAREQISSVIAAIEAQRDFWISDADLQAALLTGARGIRGEERSTSVPGRAARGH